MLRILLHWFVGFLEVIGFVAAILIAGLAVATAAFWVLSRALSLLGTNLVESGPYEFEEDDDYEPDDQGIHDRDRADLTPPATSSHDLLPPSH